MKNSILIKISIGSIILLAVLFRIWGVNYDLPYIYNPDEPEYIRISQEIFTSGDLNPHFFNYPSLFLYLNSLAYIPYFFIEKLIGNINIPIDIKPPISIIMGVTFTPMPSNVLLGRLVTIVFGVALVGLVYIVGKQISGKEEVGLCASFLVAISPINVSHSRLITPDTFLTFFCMASILFIILIFQQGRLSHYILAGIFIGLTVSTKYNGFLILIPLIFAHFFNSNLVSRRLYYLLLAFLFCAFSFLVTTPYSLIDFTHFIQDLNYEALHYSSGHPGMEGDSLIWYLHYLWTTNAILYVIAGIGTLYGLLLRLKESLLLSVFPIVYFVFISNFIVRNDRTLLPVIPFLILIASWFFIDILQKTNTISSKKIRIISIISVIILMTSSFSVNFYKTITDAKNLTQPDSRKTARLWINNHLPNDAKIAIESYSPWVDPLQFDVNGFAKIIDREPDWYRSQGYEYLIFSEGMFGRYFREPQKYINEYSQYQKFFTEFDLEKFFNDGGYEIRIYHIDK